MAALVPAGTLLPTYTMASMVRSTAPVTTKATSFSKTLKPKAPRVTTSWPRKRLLNGGRATSLVPPPVTGTPGQPFLWEAGLNVHAGVVSLGSGNLTLSQWVTGWKAPGPGVSLSLYFNNQSTTTGGPVGPKWTHSYSKSISGTNPALLTDGDGRVLSFALSGGSYVSPPGLNQVLVQNSNGTWKRTFKDGGYEVYNASGQLITLSDASGHQTTITYSGGQISQVTDSVGRSLTFGYTSSKLTSLTDPEGKVWSIAYDGSGRPTSVTEPLLGGNSYSTTFAYGTSNNVSGTTDRRGKSWSYAYSSTNTFTSTTDPQGNVSGQVTSAPTTPDTNQYNSDHPGTVTATPDTVGNSYPTNTVAVAYVEDSGGVAAEYGIDATGRITAQRDGTGAQVNFSYDSNNNRTSVTGPDGATTSFTFDSRGNQLTVTDPNTNVTTQTFDTNNNRLTLKDGLNNTTTWTYDSSNRVVTSTEPTGGVWTYTYNANGKLATATNPQSQVATNSYDAYGNLTSAVDELGNATTYTYTLDRVASRTDSLGRTTTYGYDAWNRQTAINYPQSGSQTFTYDAEDHLTQAVDGTGTRTYTYNNLGQVTATTDPRGNTTASWDAAGRLLAQTDVTGRSLVYGYDDAGRVISTTDGNGVSETLTLDSRGRVTKQTLSNGYSVGYTYDSASRRTSQKIYVGSSPFPTSVSNTTYDSANRPIQVTESSPSSTTSYTYDSAGRLLTENRTGNSPYTSTYTYNTQGNLATSVKSNNGVAASNATYGYDSGSRLTSVTDSVAGNSTLAWNTDGSLASVTKAGAPYVQRFTYDEERRITQISRDFGGGNNQAVYQYGYGFDGARRWRKDLTAGVWYWYPCGAACSAGELVVLQSTNSGSTWTVAQRNVGGSQQNSDTLMPSGTSVSTNRYSGGVLTSDVRDAFGALRSGTNNLKGLAQTEDDGVTMKDGEGYLAQFRQTTQQQQISQEKLCDAQYDNCKIIAANNANACNNNCTAAIGGSCAILCAAICAASLGFACGFCIGACAAGLKTCYDRCRDKANRDQRNCYNAYLECLKGKKKKPVPIKADATQAAIR